MLPFLLNPVGQMQGAYDNAANQQENDYFGILRKMANMPDPAMPEPSQPQFDLKGMLIGSALAGLLGGGEGANAFLQGTMLGKQYSSQQDNVRKEQEYRKQKMAQDRELGILKTEAEIANAKANRAFQRSENLRRDTQAELNRQAIEKRQASTQKAMDLRAAEEDLGNAKSPIAFDLALSRLQRAGGKVDPWQAVNQRGQLVQNENEVKQAKESEAKRKQFQPTFNKYLGVMLGNGKPGDKAFAAQMVRQMMNENPEFAGASGISPAQIEMMFSQHSEAVKTLTRVQQLDERMKQLNADTKEFDLKFKKKTEKDKLLEASAKRKEAEAKAQMATEDAKNPEAAAKRKMLTDTGYLSSWRVAQGRYVEAVGKQAEAKNLQAMWLRRAKERRNEKTEFTATPDYPTREAWAKEAEETAQYYGAQVDALNELVTGAKVAMTEVERFAKQSWGETPPVSPDLPPPDRQPSAGSRSDAMRKKYGY